MRVRVEGREKATSAMGDVLRRAVEPNAEPRELARVSVVFHDQDAPAGELVKLDLNGLASVAPSSDSPPFDVAGSLSPRAGEWRAPERGAQVMPLRFGGPHHLTCIRVVFRDDE